MFVKPLKRHHQEQIVLHIATAEVPLLAVIQIPTTNLRLEVITIVPHEEALTQAIEVLHHLDLSIPAVALDHIALEGAQDHRIRLEEGVLLEVVEINIL